MGNLNTSKKVIKFSNSNFGENLKNAVDQLVNLCNSLSLKEVTTDTADTYDVTFLWRQYSGATIRFTNAAATAQIVIYDNDFQICSTTAINILSAGQTTIASFKGTDWEAWQFIRGTAAASAAALIVTDYYLPGTKVLLGGTTATPFAPLNIANFYGNNNGAVQTIDKYPIGPVATPNTMVANPVNFYSADMRFSGFVGGLDNIYYLYSGAAVVNTSTVGGSFLVDNKTFVGGGGAAGYCIGIK